MIEQPIFLRNSNPRILVQSFVDALDRSATETKAQMILKFLEKETSVKTKLTQIFSPLNQRRCCKEPVLDS